MFHGQTYESLEQLLAAGTLGSDLNDQLAHLLTQAKLDSCEKPAQQAEEASEKSDEDADGPLEAELEDQNKSDEEPTPVIELADHQ